MNISDIERLLDNSATIETKIEILPRYAGESLITITNDDSIKSWEYADTRYVPDNGFIGMFVERTIEGELHNITTDFNIENREIILYLGIRVYDVDSKTYTTTFYSLGNFIVDKPESDEVKDNTKFTAKDYTIKFNVNFNPDYTDDEYTKSFTTMLSEQGSVTALWLAEYTCKQCGMELGNEEFTNSDFVIDSNQFQNGEQCRDIIKAIAKLACSWARIDWDNKVYIDFYVKDNVEHDYNNITKDDYYELTVQKDTYGPVNKVVFGSSIIEGDYSFVSDSESMVSNGENSFVINDNPILYTEEIRERAVQNASTLLGLQYTPLEVETTGHPWLKGNELISVQDSADNLVYTYPLDRVIEYDGHIKTLITSYAPTKVEENYAYSGTGTSKNTQRQTKIILDRANQQLQTLVEKTDEQSSKITSLTQDLDSVNITVSNVQKDLETTNSNLESTNNNVDDLQSQIQGVSADFDDFKDNEYVQSIDNLQKQIDGAIQFWNGDEIPTLNNYPANGWITEADRINHQADIYTVIQDIEGELKQGKAYRFDKVDGVWQWIELTDNELSAVQAIAQDALNKANANASNIGILQQTDTEIKADIEGIELNYETLNNRFESTVITSKTIEDNPIHITDAGAYDLEKLYLEGNSYQETEPTPDTPQEVEVIEGSVDVDVVGKNVLKNITFYTWINNGSATHEKIDDCIKINMPETPLRHSGVYMQSWGTNYTDYTNDLALLQGKQCVYSFYAKADTNRKIYFQSTGDTTIVNIDLTTEWQRFSYVIPSLGTDVPTFYCSTSLETASFYIKDIMLEKGSELSDYEPHKSTTATLDLQGNFLAKIGDVYDELDVVTGKLTKRIGKVVLDGSENWITNGNWNNSNPDKYHIYIKLSDFASSSILIDKFSTISYWVNNLSLEGCYVQSTSALYLFIDSTRLNEYSVAGVKAWLASNNVTVYYVLAEPYEVQLDQTAIRLNQGINNISVITNLEPSYVSLTYLTDALLNSQYATRSQLQLAKDSIQSVVKDTTTLNADLTDLQALVSVETTDLKNALGDLSNNLEDNYATNDSVLTIENSVSNIQTSLNQQIEITRDIQLNGVSKVKTTTGFTFDEDGLTITKTNAETKTNIDEDGMVVYSTTGAENTEMLVVDSQGVQAENVTVRTYLVVGQNSRFQDYETGTGCFWVGE